MNRSEFLKSIGLGASGLILPKNIDLRFKPVKIYENYVKGLPHYHFQKLSRELKKGTQLQLEREMLNPHDSFAISVYYHSHKLGYLAAFENIVPANMLDQGVELVAEVNSINLNDQSLYTSLSVAIYANLISAGKKLVARNLLDKPAHEAKDYYRQGY